MLNIGDKQGYKYTEEFGYIPEGWEVKPLEDYISNKKYAIVDGPFGSNLKTEHYRKSGVPIVQSGFVTSNIFKADDYLYVDKEKFQKEIRSKVEAGDIVMAKIGANCGTCAILPKEHPTSILAGNSLKISVDENSTEYLLYLFHRMLPLNMMEEAISRTAQPALSVGRLKKLKILVPPIPEQEKIAEVLGDVDSLIDKTQQLINKKKDLKTATIQKLFKNQENFQQVNLPNIVWFQEGPGIRTWQFTKSGMKVINVTNLENGYLNLDKTDRHISMDEYHSMYEHFSIDEGDIVMASSGNSYSKVAIVRKQDLPLLMNTSVIRFKSLDGITYGYLLTFLRSSLFKDQIDLLITGGAQPNFGPAHLKKILIPLPSIDEQNRIATILSDMDSEIEALEKELNKYKDLKTGMMQQLLTGKVRLI